MFIPCCSTGYPNSSKLYEGMTVYHTATFELKTYKDGRWHPVNKGITIDDL